MAQTRVNSPLYIAVPLHTQMVQCMLEFPYIPHAGVAAAADKQYGQSGVSAVPAFIRISLFHQLEKCPVTVSGERKTAQRGLLICMDNFRVRADPCAGAFFPGKLCSP